MGWLRTLIVQTSAEFVEVAGKRRQPARVGSSNLGSARQTMRYANAHTNSFTRSGGEMAMLIGATAACYGARLDPCV